MLLWRCWRCKCSGHHLPPQNQPALVCPDRRGEPSRRRPLHPHCPPSAVARLLGGESSSEEVAAAAGVAWRALCAHPPDTSRGRTLLAGLQKARCGEGGAWHAWECGEAVDGPALR